MNVFTNFPKLHSNCHHNKIQLGIHDWCVSVLAVATILRRTFTPNAAIRTFKSVESVFKLVNITPSLQLGVTHSLIHSFVRPSRLTYSLCLLAYFFACRVHFVCSPFFPLILFATYSFPILYRANASSKMENNNAYRGGREKKEHNNTQPHPNTKNWTDNFARTFVCC